MSFNLETLQKQISGGEDLSSIVRTMKALAATSVRQYEKAAEALDDYYHTVEMGLSVVLESRRERPVKRRGEEERPVLMLVFGSDHGLAGSFNEQIVYYALGKHWAVTEETLPANRIVAGIGEQVISRIRAAGTGQEEGFNMPTSIEAITPFVQLLLQRIDRWRTEKGTQRVFLFYNRPQTNGFSPRGEILLPVNLEQIRETRRQWHSRSLPVYTMPAGELLSALLRQFFFVGVYRACALSLAAENISRLAAMQAAEKNIDERLTELKTAYQQERQAVITEELLDIVSGFKAGMSRKREDDEVTDNGKEKSY